MLTLLRLPADATPISYHSITVVDGNSPGQMSSFTVRSPHIKSEYELAQHVSEVKSALTQSRDSVLIPVHKKSALSHSRNGQHQCGPT